MTDQNVLFMFPHQTPGLEEEEGTAETPPHPPTTSCITAWSGYVTLTICSGLSVDGFAELPQRQSGKYLETVHNS